MDNVEQILRRNQIKPDSVEPSDVSPKDSRRSYLVKSGSEIYHLSFPRDRDSPISKKTVEQKIDAEVYTFNIIAEETSLRSPEVADYSNDYVLIKEIEGERTINIFKDANKKKQDEIARKLGVALSKIHSISLNSVGYFDDSEVGEEFETWREFFEPWINEVIDAAETSLEQRAANYLEENIDVIDVKISPTIVYGDFQPWNTISSQNKPLGIIDGESGFAGHKEYDLAQAAVAWSNKFDVTDGFIEGYQNSGDLEKGWQQRHEYYKLYLFASAMIDARAVGWTGLAEEFEQRLENLLEELI